MYLTQKLNASVSDLASVTEEYNSEVEDINESDDSRSVRDKSYGIKLDVEELEMLLEAYFAQINGILQKLTSLSEYVDDIEDYINIMLDDKRNQLLQVSITLNTINMIVNAGIVVVGLFCMNIHIDLFDGKPRQFWATTAGTLVGCILLFLVSVWWGKKRYLLSQ
nr:magnesium transporter MRS2-F-like [Cicer arietinum]